MSDTKLRELERRWKESGAVDDEAAYLLERVRVGDLSGERLDLAAYCGHEGATAARGTPLATPFSRDWFDELKSKNSEAQTRIALAAAQQVRSRFECHFPSDNRLDRAISLTEGLLTGEHPCPAEFAVQVAFDLNDAIQDRRRQANYYRSARKAAISALAALECAALSAGLGVVYWSENCGEAAAKAVGAALDCGVSEEGSVDDDHRKALNLVLRQEVVRWALRDRAGKT